MIDENHIVSLLRRRFGGRGAELIRGIGDDAAVLRPRGSREYWVVTTDMLLEDVDFRRSWLTPAQLGHKALAVNLSDLAAMGARPRFYTVALALPADLGEAWIEALYRGMSKLARRQGALLIGGDLSRSPFGVQVTITAIGTASKPMYRSGGRPGDILYVTGSLGKAAAGLALLRRGRVQGRCLSERRALKAQRTPDPRCEVGAWLAGSGFARCMMDLSDGISMDLPRLCEASGVGAEIFSEQLPMYPDSSGWQCDPVALALHGGEDFELLFAVPARKAERFEEAYPPGFPPLSRIGYLRRARGIVWAPRSGTAPQPLNAAGFDHFRI
ncbi:MAG: thiamine-phosphate kinase [Acidobacteriota bacterium]